MKHKGKIPTKFAKRLLIQRRRKSVVGRGDVGPAAMPEVEPIGAIWYTIRRKSQTRRDHGQDQG